MSHWGDIWRARRRQWVPALVFLLLQVALLAVWQFALADRMGAQSTFLATTEREAEQVAERRATVEAALAEALRTGQGIREIKHQTLGPLEVRLTATMSQVKELARVAGLRGPTAISYPEEEVEGFGLTRKAFVFTVSGSYQDLREFVNLLELTDSFLVLEQVELKGGTPGNLEIQLRLSTLFLTPEGPRRGSA